MNLHEFKEDFYAIANIVSRYKNIPEKAVIRDYYIVLMLDKLGKSEYAEKCVFKGGTSLSKCYPNTIERFSEDIDLTYLGIDEDDNTCDKAIRGIIRVMTEGANVAKIPGEGSSRSKSRKVWFDSESDNVKLEIGSTVRPDPYYKKTIKSYIHEYFEEHGMIEQIKEFGLVSVELNTLAIERTFLDKVMAVKRHAICGSLNTKVRHIYDVVKMFDLSEIQNFLKDKKELKRILKLTKETDSYYLEKRNISKEYNPLGAYDFDSWKGYFNEDIKKIYERLHEELLYTDEKQDFNLAIKTFEQINEVFKSIDE